MARAYGSSGGEVGWGFTSLILLADMLGLGALAMPSAFARLGGFVPATAVIILFGCIAAYSGSLYARLMSVPLPRERAGREAEMLDEVGDEALGVFVLTFIAAVESLQQVLRGARKVWDVDVEVNRLYSTLIVAGVALPVLQLRKLKDLGFVSAIASTSMLAALVIIILKLAWLDAKEYEPKHGPDWAAPVPLLPATVGAMDVLFGYAGQQAWPRFIIAMRRPRANFAHATNFAIPTIGAALLAVGAVGYWRLGYDFDHSKPVSSVLKQDGWMVAANVGVLVQSLVATVLNLNTWVWSVMAIYFKTVNRHKRGPSTYERLTTDPEPVASSPAGAPGAEEEPATGEAGVVEPDPSSTSRWPWLILSILGLGAAAVGAYFLPFFAEVMALVGSLADTAVMMTLPALFGLLLLPKHEDVPRWEWWLLLAMVALSIAGSALGATASIWQIHRKLKRG